MEQDCFQVWQKLKAAKFLLMKSNMQNSCMEINPQGYFFAESYGLIDLRKVIFIYLKRLGKVDDVTKGVVKPTRIIGNLMKAILNETVVHDTFRHKANQKRNSKWHLFIPF